MSASSAAQPDSDSTAAQPASMSQATLASAAQPAAVTSTGSTVASSSSGVLHIDESSQLQGELNHATVIRLNYARESKNSLNRNNYSGPRGKRRSNVSCSAQSVLPAREKRHSSQVLSKTKSSKKAMQNTLHCCTTCLKTGVVCS